ncbi:MAG: putative toxin-antitoxin system toxin component, PIN family [Pseudomonadota bacterium]
MRIFLDTNVLVSALTTRGLCAALFESVLVEHDLLASAGLLAELRRILSDRFRMPPAVVDGYIELIGTTAELVVAIGPAPDGIPDPDDAPLIAAALAGGAACFVTGDKALLALGAAGGLPLISPREFWERTRIGA